MATKKASSSKVAMQKYVRRNLRQRGVTPTPKLEERSARERRLRKKLREEYKAKNSSKPGTKTVKTNVGDAKDKISSNRTGVGDAKDRIGRTRTPSLSRGGGDAKDRLTRKPNLSPGTGGDAKDRKNPPRKSPTSAAGMYPNPKKSRNPRGAR